MPPTLQRTLDLRNPDGTRTGRLRPLLGMESAKLHLDLHEDEILGLIQEGRIRWAWDISAGDRRRAFVRIWSESVIGYQYPQHEQPDDLAEVIDRILPENSRITRLIRATELQRTFNTTGGHVLGLVEGKELTAAKGTTWRTGPGGSPDITRDSVIGFLTRRVMQ